MQLERDAGRQRQSEKFTFDMQNSCAAFGNLRHCHTLPSCSHLVLSLSPLPSPTFHHSLLSLIFLCIVEILRMLSIVCVCVCVLSWKAHITHTPHMQKKWYIYIFLEQFYALNKATKMLTVRQQNGRGWQRRLNNSLYELQWEKYWSEMSSWLS